MCAGDLLGNLGQRGITHSGVFKPILRHRDGMGAAVPFANQTRTGLQAKAWRCANPSGRSQGLCYRLQLATRRLAEPAVLDFLKSVTERKGKEVAADLWWFAGATFSSFAGFFARLASATFVFLGVLRCDIFEILSVATAHAPSPPRPRSGDIASGAGSERRPKGPRQQ